MGSKQKMTSLNISTATKVCLDANIFVSALLFGGKPDEILDFAALKQIKIIASPVIFMELRHVLTDKFGWSDNDTKQALKSLMAIVTLIEPKHKLNKIKYGPDNRILECALEGKVDYIVTGDKKHLLPLGEFEGIKIVTATEFLKIVHNSH